VTYVIAEPCVDVMDKACIDECPVDCIYEGGRMLYIHPDECIDCSACEPVCPVDAIYFEQDLPREWVDFVDANADFFDDIGSPGGASAIGKREQDAALVATITPRTAAAPPREAPPPVWVSIARMGRGWLRCSLPCCRRRFRGRLDRSDTLAG